MRAALRAQCPSCGSPTLFDGWLRFVDRCTRCGLDFSAMNVGDGPAALLMLPLGAIVVAGALTMHFALGAPWWLQLLVWPPTVTVLTIGGLRLVKAWLFAVEYRRAAREGRLG